MANAWMIGDSDLLRCVIKRELKDHGVKIGKLKGNSRTYSGPRNLQNQDKGLFSPVFGVALSSLPCCKDPQTGLEIPRFVKECVEFLRQHLDEEGLFRKSGSHARQKELQNQLSRGNPLPQDCQVADVASILKRFFRDLPEPIIHPRHQAWILKCVAMEDEILKEWTTLLLLCILPARNLQLLRYIMIFLADVASKSENNRMDPKNLALVLVPSILGGDSGLGKTVQIERQIKLQTVVIEIMISNAKDIGLVPDYVLDRMVKTKNRSSEALDYLTSEDELERSSDDNLENNLRIKRKKRRSGTFHGIVNGLGQMGQKVGGLLKSSSSLDNLDKTPENLNSVETPNALRLSKRKASDDIGSVFSASKRRTPSPVRNSILRRSLRTRRKSSPMQRRKAILKQMTVDPHYGKKGVNLHKSTPSSPMTPLQSTKPALGEIDALDSEGKTLFHFNTPSIKFADDSFSGFSSTPSTSSVTDPPPTGMTPRRNKLKKLNPLNSRRFKRLSLGAIGGSSRAEAPVKIPQRQQNNQHPSKYSVPEANIGHRLANQPNPGGFDTTHLVPRRPECREAYVRCPPSQSDKEVPSTMYTPPSYLMKTTTDATEGDKENPSFVTKKLSEPPCMEVNHLENEGYHLGAEHLPKGCNDAEQIDDRSPSSKFQRPRTQSCLSVRCASPLAMCLSNNLLEDDAMLLGEEYSPKPTRISKEDASVTDWNAKSSQSHAINLVGRSNDDKVNEEKLVEERSRNNHLPGNVSQKSLSSVLSSVTVNSTKSYFSVEVEPVRMERPLCLFSADTKPETTEVVGISSDECDMEGTGMEVDMHTETRSEPILSKKCNISNSLGALHEIPSANRTAEWILKKTISVDSGKGESIEDLEQPTHDRNDRETSKEIDNHVTSKTKQETVHDDGEFSEPSRLRESSRQSSYTSKVNPSKLRPLKVDHNSSSMEQFRMMQKRMQMESGRREAKTVKQKIRMFNSLSEDDMSDSGRDGSVSFVRHHSGSDLPVCIYAKDADGSFLQVPGKCDIQTVTLSPLVKSVSYESGLKELSKLASTDKEQHKPSVQQKVLRKMSSKSSEEDSFEAAMNSANRALSNFKRFAAESSTPTATRKALGDKSNHTHSQWSSPPSVLAPYQVRSTLQRSPAFLLKSPTYKKQLKRLDAEGSPNWQRRSPREKVERDNYMHMLRSPRGHQGSPRNPLEGSDRKGRRRSRHVRREWQV